MALLVSTTLLTELGKNGTNFIQYIDCTACVRAHAHTHTHTHTRTLVLPLPRLGYVDPMNGAHQEVATHTHKPSFLSLLLFQQGTMQASVTAVVLEFESQVSFFLMCHDIDSHVDMFYF